MCVEDHPVAYQIDCIKSTYLTGYISLPTCDTQLDIQIHDDE